MKTHSMRKGEWNMKFGMIRNAADRAAFEYVQGKGLEFIEVCMNYTKNAEEFIARGGRIPAPLHSLRN